MDDAGKDSAQWRLPLGGLRASDIIAVVIYAAVAGYFLRPAIVQPIRLDPLDVGMLVLGGTAGFVLIRFAIGVAIETVKRLFQMMRRQV